MPAITPPLPAPERGYSFTGFQSVNPSSPLPADMLDAELDRAFNGMEQAVNWARQVIADDGTVKAGVVGLSALAPEVLVDLPTGVTPGLTALADSAIAAKNDAQAAATAAAASASTASGLAGSNVYCGPAGGTANAMTLTPGVAVGSYSAGLTVRAIMGAGANTGAVTLNVSGLGAVALNKGDGTAPLVANDLPGNSLFAAVYDGTRFRLVSVTLTPAQARTTLGFSVTGEALATAVSAAAARALLGATTLGSDLFTAATAAAARALLGTVDKAGDVVNGNLGFGDVAFYAGLAGGSPIIGFDANDYDAYIRTLNRRQTVIGGVERVGVDATGLSVTGFLSVSANATVSGPGGVAAANTAKAWASFNMTANADLTGTYTRAGTMVTVTATNHGHVAGHQVYLDFTSGAAVDGQFEIVSVTDANAFTVTHGTSGATSGNVTLKRFALRSAFGVQSVTQLAGTTGAAIVNWASGVFTTNTYAWTASAQNPSGMGFNPGCYVTGNSGAGSFSANHLNIGVVRDTIGPTDAPIVNVTAFGA